MLDTIYLLFTYLVKIFILIYFSIILFVHFKLNYIKFYPIYPKYIYIHLFRNHRMDCVF